MSLIQTNTKDMLLLVIAKYFLLKISKPFKSNLKIFIEVNTVLILQRNNLTKNL